MTISTTTIKDSYNGNGSTSAFTYTFKIADDDDIQVIIRAANGTETVKTKTTHYTVSGVGDNSGTVTFTAGNIPISGQTIILRRSTPQTQELDLIENDPLPANSIETAYDKLTQISQELQEQINRSIKLSRTNTISSTEFTVGSADRANKVLAFDENGEIAVTQELGTFKGNWATATSYNVRDLVKDTSTANIFIVNTAHTSVGSQPLTSNAEAAKYTLIIDAASATSSATAAASSAASASASQSAAASSAASASSSASAASSSASSSSSSASASAASAASAATSYDEFDDRYLGSKSSAPTLDNDGNALIDGALYWNSVSAQMFVRNSGAWVAIKPTSVEQGHITTVAGISADVSTVAGANVNINILAGISADITTVASNAGDISTVSTDIAKVITAANDLNEAVSEIDTVANAIANVDLVGNNIGNVNLVGASISNVNTVGSNIGTVNDFHARYRVVSSDPATSLDAGDLAFNTSVNALKYYDGSNWQSIVAGGLSDVVQDGSPQLGGNLDVNGFNITSASNGNVTILPNGTGKVSIDGIFYPTADGTANQVIITDGAGNLSFGTVQASEITTVGNVFSNYNEISTNTTTTTASTKNSFLCGAITVSGSAIWTLSGNGTLTII
jgi:hypothetical protein